MADIAASVLARLKNRAAESGSWIQREKHNGEKYNLSIFQGTKKTMISGSD